MRDIELKARLSTSKPITTPPDAVTVDTVEVVAAPTRTWEPLATQVMASYQNANKWLDIIKEELLMTQGCVFFSTYVHNLAHTMPARFDKFGDILHTADFKVPYPGTAYIPEIPGDINGSFTMIFDILGAISESLRGFIKETQDTEYHAMSCAAEELLVDIEGEYPNLYRMQRAYHASSDNIIKFDKWVQQYVDHLGSILG